MLNIRLNARSTFTDLGPTNESEPALPKVPRAFGVKPAEVSHTRLPGSLKLRTYGLPATLGRSSPMPVSELSSPVSGVNQTPLRATRIGESFQLPTKRSPQVFFSRGDWRTAETFK